MPKPKPHLVITSSPLAENSACVGLCGKEIQKAKIAFLWDDVELGLLFIPPRGTCLRCCVEFTADRNRAYVFAVREWEEGDNAPSEA
jgi:hypothetical protein